MKISTLFENKSQRFQDIYDDDQKIAEMIERDCGPWLTASKGKLAFRGESRGRDERFFKGEIRQNRTPKDMQSTAASKLSMAVTELGWKTTRFNSVFVTGDPTQANSYGRLYVVFPIGQFDYTWSQTIHDMVSIEGKIASASVEQLKELVLNKGYHYNQYLDRAIDSGHEIWVHAKSYYAVRIDIFINRIKPLMKTKTSSRWSNLAKEVAFNMYQSPEFLEKEQIDFIKEFAQEIMNDKDADIMITAEAPLLHSIAEDILEKEYPLSQTPFSPYILFKKAVQEYMATYILTKDPIIKDFITRYSIKDDQDPTEVIKFTRRNTGNPIQHLNDLGFDVTQWGFEPDDDMS